MPEIRLYIQPGFQVPGRPRCYSGTPFAIKVARVLGCKRLAFETREVSWQERADVLPALSASGKLPVLEYDGQRIEDSTAIAHFLEARHPEPRLVPADPVARARSHFVEAWADEVLYWFGIYEVFRFGDADVVSRAYFPHLDDEARAALAVVQREATEEALSRQGIGRYPVDKMKADARRGLDALAGFVEPEGFVAGAALSLGDVAAFGQLHRRLAGTNPWLEAEVKSRPALLAWLDRVDRATRP